MNIDHLSFHNQPGINLKSVAGIDGQQERARRHWKSQCNHDQDSQTPSLLLFQREAKPFPIMPSRLLIYRLPAIDRSLGKTAPEKSVIYNTSVITMSTYRYVFFLYLNTGNPIPIQKPDLSHRNIGKNLPMLTDVPVRVLFAPTEITAIIDILRKE
jgi:hypothetical protein